MPRNQNWERRDINSYGPKFRIDTNNPQMGTNGTNVYALYAVTDNKDVNFSGLTESGTYRIWNDKTIEFIGGNKDSSDGVDIVIAGMNGDVTITAMRNGAVKIKGKNIVIEADEDIDLKAGRNININGKSRVLIKGNKCETDGLLGNLIPESFGSLVFSKSYVGGDIISNSFMAGLPNVIGTAQDIAIGAKDALSSGPGSFVSGSADFAKSSTGLSIDSIFSDTIHAMQSPESFAESLNSIITED